MVLENGAATGQIYLVDLTGEGTYVEEGIAPKKRLEGDSTVTTGGEWEDIVQRKGGVVF